MPLRLFSVLRASIPLLSLIALLCLIVPLAAQERPWSVSPCELLKNPGKYNESLVSVPGLVLYGAQEFTSHAYDSADDYGVLRLEFGGEITDPRDRFRLSQTELEASAVPLKKDADYDNMLRLMKQADASGKTKMLRATLTGRFFAGPAVGTKSGEIKYPHARLVISEVELVTNRLEDPVDFTPISSALSKPPKGCAASELPVPSRDDDDKLQRLSRESSENLQYLADPIQVAARAIAQQDKISADEIASKLHSTSEGVAINTYAWTSSNGLRTYNITVDRPYWLLPSTYSADTVIWVPKRMVRTLCVGKTAG